MKQLLENDIVVFKKLLKELGCDDSGFRMRDIKSKLYCESNGSGIEHLIFIDESYMYDITENSLQKRKEIIENLDNINKYAFLNSKYCDNRIKLASKLLKDYKNEETSYPVTAITVASVFIIALREPKDMELMSHLLGWLYSDK